MQANRNGYFSALIRPFKAQDKGDCMMLKGFFKVFLLFAGLAAAIAGLCRVFGSSANEYVEIYGDEDEEDVF